MLNKLKEYVTKLLRKDGFELKQFDIYITNITPSILKKVDNTPNDGISSIETENYITLLKFQSERALSNTDRQKRLLSLRPLSTSDKEAQELSRKKYGIQLGKL